MRRPWATVFGRPPPTRSCTGSSLSSRRMPWRRIWASGHGGRTSARRTPARRTRMSGASCAAGSCGAPAHHPQLGCPLGAAAARSPILAATSRRYDQLGLDEGMRKRADRLALRAYATHGPAVRAYRMIYFGLACLHAGQARFDIGPLADDLRGGLYNRPYASVGFARGRGRLAAEVVVPPGRLLRFAAAVQARYERHAVRTLRAAAVRRCAARIETELAASAGHGISPVSALVGCLALASTGTPNDVVLAALGRVTYVPARCLGLRHGIACVVHPRRGPSRR